MKTDPDFEQTKVFAAVESALRTQFGFDARDLGQPVQQSEVIAVAHSVLGVIAVDLDLLYRGTTPSRHDAPARGADDGASRRTGRRRVAHARPGAVRSFRGNAMSLDVDTLYDLLPAVYRVRDDAEGKPLRALLAVIAREFEALEENLDQLYDDQFIETCADWVVPYIGDLVGYRPLHGIAGSVVSPQAEVANTIAFRRRKGTALMLEQLARDVTDWPARAVEFFEQLATTQYMNHLRPHAVATATVRSQRVMLPLGGPFRPLRTRQTFARRRGVAGTTFRTSASSCGGCRPSRSPRCPLCRSGRYDGPTIQGQSARRRRAAVPSAANGARYRPPGAADQRPRSAADS